MNDDGWGPETAMLSLFHYLLITKERKNHALSEYEDMPRIAGFVEIKSFKRSDATGFISGGNR